MMEHDQQAQVVSFFITDILAASIGQGNGVTTVATPFQYLCGCSREGFRRRR
jgi:hypothetical protein